VDVEGPPAAQCSVWPDGVEELPVALGFESELVAVVDLFAVEVLVLQRAEGAVDERREAGGLEAGAVIRDERLSQLPTRVERLAADARASRPLLPCRTTGLFPCGKN
jgi:hypothetical protein